MIFIILVIFIIFLNPSWYLVLRRDILYFRRTENAGLLKIMILFCRQILYLPGIKNVANKGSLTVNCTNPFPGSIKKIAILSPAGIPDPEKIRQAVDWFA